MLLLINFIFNLYISIYYCLLFISWYLVSGIWYLVYTKYTKYNKILWYFILIIYKN